MKNQLIADLFYAIADLLEIQNVQFKPRAYRLAAQTIESYPEAIEELYKTKGSKGLEELPGIGASIAEKVVEILTTGKLRYYNELRKQLPIDADIITIEGIGPKRAKYLYEKLGIRTLKQLEQAARAGKISTIKMFGMKVEENILKGIQLKRETTQPRFLLGYILKDIEKIKNELEKLTDVEAIEIGGSIRRKKETIGDADILITSSHPETIMDAFTTLPTVKEILAKGPTRSTIRLLNNLKVDLRVLPHVSYAAALQYFTGNQNHNITLRKIAISKKLKLSEYGLFRGTKNIVAGKTEKDLYNALGLDYIEPELREDQGEIEAAQQKKLPKLVTLNDLQGDLHSHTNATDGTASMEDMAAAAAKLGRKYYAITEHTKALGIAHGLNERQILTHIQKIRTLNKKYPNMTILAGVELNIMRDGKPDIAENVLKQLDIVIGSIHSGFKDPEEKMTQRVLTAIENKHIDIIGHPTGRLIQRRDPFQINLQKVFAAAHNTGTALEINSYPDRLDLKDTDIREAIKHHVKLVINTDAHATTHLAGLKYGVFQARRGWAEKKNILNTLSLDKFLKQLK